MDNINEQIKALAEAHEDGIDTLAAGMQDMYKILDHLTNQLRNSDILLASMRHLLVQKGVVTKEELEAMQSNIAKIANQSLEELVADKTKPVVENMQDELKVIHEAAEKAAAKPYDSDAFIFSC